MPVSCIAQSGLWSWERECFPSCRKLNVNPATPQKISLPLSFWNLSRKWGLCRSNIAEVLKNIILGSEQT